MHLRLWTDLNGTVYGQYWSTLVLVLNSYTPFKLFTDTLQRPFQWALFSLYPFHYKGDVGKDAPYHHSFLFALSPEPLAQALRQSPIITPVTLLGSRHHISLYADDIILYLSDLNNSAKCFTVISSLEQHVWIQIQLG